NHRIERFDESGRFDTSGFNVANNGAFIGSLGGKGTRQDQFEPPLGLAFDELHQKLFVADSGNNRVVATHPVYTALITSGEEGSSLGQFRQPRTISVSD